MTYIRVMVLTALFVGSWSRADGAIATWNPSPEPVLGYILAYGTQPGVHTDQIDVGNVVTCEFFPPPGQRYYVVVWAYNAVGHGPKSAEVLLDLTGTTNQPPTLMQPANQFSVRGQPASLMLVGNDPEGTALTYSASGLPPGLSVNAATGAVTGAPITAGSYAVVASVSDGLLSASQTFTWLVAEPPPPPDTTPPAVTISSPQANDIVNGKKVKLTALASDANGIAGVRFLLNGVAIGGEDTVAPYSITWNSTTVVNGTYQLTAIARDMSNNVGSSASIPIVVRNGRRAETATADAAALSLTIWKEVAASHHLDKILGSANVRNRVQAAMDGPAHEALPANGTPERHQGNDGPDPGDGPGQPSGQFLDGVMSDRPGVGHEPTGSKCRSAIVAGLREVGRPHSKERRTSSP